MLAERCQLCKRVLDDPADATTRNCGGDCLKCMAEIGEDPDCIRALREITKAGNFSDEAPFCPVCIAFVAEGHDLTPDGTIIGPGKFEGQHIAVYHAYHVMLDGGQDDDGGPEWRVGNVLCYESIDGFVWGTIFDTEEEAIADWE
jgi:hypothetical protein